MSISNQIIRPGLITPGNASYASVVLADKPVGFWPLNETAGILVHDASGHGNTGTIQGGVTLNRRGASGGSAAMAFNGSTGVVATPLITGAVANVTLEGWVLVTPTSKGAIVFNGYNGNGYGIGLGGASAGRMSAQGNYLNALFEGVRWIQTDTVVPDGWHLVHLVLDSRGTPSVYLDATLLGTYPGNNAEAPTTHSYIGLDGETGGSRYSNTLLQACAIYAYSLSPAQIRSHYNAGRTALRLVG